MVSHVLNTIAGSVLFLSFFNFKSEYLIQQLLVKLDGCICINHCLKLACSSHQIGFPV